MQKEKTGETGELCSSIIVVEIKVEVLCERFDAVAPDNVMWRMIFQRGVIDICCDVVLVRGIYSCPSRRNRKAVCNELKS